MKMPIFSMNGMIYLMKWSVLDFTLDAFMFKTGLMLPWKSVKTVDCKKNGSKARALKPFLFILQFGLKPILSSKDRSDGRFPDQQNRFIVVELNHFFFGKNDVFNASIDEPFGFFYQRFYEWPIEMLSNQSHINNFWIFANCKITGKVCRLKVAYLARNLFGNLVDANELLQDIINVAEKRMLDIREEHLFISLDRWSKQACIFHPVQFHPYGIGWFPEFSFQASQVTLCLTVQKKFE